MAFKGDFDALILGVLASGPAHGYEIVQRIGSIDPEALRTGEGHVYPILYRLENDEYIHAQWEREGRRPPRKVYSLTLSGRKKLEEKRADWTRFQKAIDQILEGKSCPN